MVFCGCKIHKNHLLIFMSQGSKVQSRKRTGRDGLLCATHMLWTSGDQEAWRNDIEAEDLKKNKTTFEWGEATLMATIAYGESDRVDERGCGDKRCQKTWLQAWERDHSAP